MEKINIDDVIKFVNLNNYNIIKNNINYSEILLKCFIYYVDIHTEITYSIKINSESFEISYYNGEFNKTYYQLFDDLEIIDKYFYVFVDKQEKELFQRKMKIKKLC